MRTDPITRYADLVGFDYAGAVRELSHKYTYEQLAESIGYGDKSSIIRVMKGETMPAHNQGEAIWALYVDTFGRKPPLRK